MIEYGLKYLYYKNENLTTKIVQRVCTHEPMSNNDKKYTSIVFM